MRPPNRGARNSVCSRSCPAHRSSSWGLDLWHGGRMAFSRQSSPSAMAESDRFDLLHQSPSIWFSNGPFHWSENDAMGGCAIYIYNIPCCRAIVIPDIELGGLGMTEKSVGSSPGADLVFGTSFSSPGSCHGHSLLLALLSQHSSGQCLAPHVGVCPNVSAPTCWMLPKHQLDGKAIGPLRPAGGMDMALGVFFILGLSMMTQ